MTKEIILLPFALFISPMTFAGSRASDPKIRFCPRMSLIQQLEDRSQEPLRDLLEDKVRTERILVSKYKREIYLISGNAVLRRFPVAFGPEPVGPKHFEGDNRTPEGLYFIDYKNPKSAYTKSLHISYPNEADKAYAKANHRSPGGDIMIHGFPTDLGKKAETAAKHPQDWTQGCVAVNDEQIEEIYQLVSEKALVEICTMAQ